MNKEDLLDFAKKNPNDIFVDKHKRIFIRPKIPKNIEAEDIILPIFTKNLLHPEERITRRSLLTWIEDLNNVFKERNVSKDNKYSKNDLEQIAVVLNQWAFILSLIGETKLAQEACLDTVLFFNHCAKFYDDLEIMKYIVQPWINFGRLARLEKNDAKAKDIFKFLSINSDFNSHNLTDKEYNLGLIINKAVSYFIPSKNNIVNVIKNCYLIENLKILLADKRVGLPERLNDYIDDEHSVYRKTVLSEAKIIFAFADGAGKKALGYLIDELNNGWLGGIQTYFYRMLEISYASNAEHVEFWLTKLRNYFDEFENSKLFDLSEVILLEKTLPFFKKLLPRNYYKKYAINCLEFYRYLDDVIGVISIDKILKSERFYDEEVNLENEIYEYIFNSGYLKDTPANLSVFEKIYQLNSLIYNELFWALK